MQDMFLDPDTIISIPNELSFGLYFITKGKVNIYEQSSEGDVYNPFSL